MIIKTYFIENMNQIIEKKICPPLIIKSIMKIMRENLFFKKAFYIFVLLFI